ncbi:MAG TPA: amidase [Candidatus Binatia bacterium]|nr:amidase [Candidatus Binatia bacterium]
MPDLTALTIAAAGARLARGGIRAAALVDAYLERIEALDPMLHCYLAVLRESARAEARAADARRARGAALGPLDGIPVAIKDNIDVAGVPTTNGLGPGAVAMPARDAEVVGRLRAAGAVILGKLNMHEAALGGTTDNPHHGRTHNPWRIGFTPGGSSGGTGAAVAARLCAGGLGTDTMGSVRLPAAFCGVAGFKPTFGLVSTRGVVPLSWRLDHVGPLCRSVSDLGLLLDAIAERDPGQVASIGAAADMRDALPLGPSDRAGQGLRIGLISSPDAAPLHADVRAAFESSVEVFRGMGARVERIALPGYDPSRTRRAGLLVIEAEAWVAHEAALAESPDAFTPELRRMLEYGRDVQAGRLIKAERLIEAAGLALRQALSEVDLVAAPTAVMPPFAFTEPAPSHLADSTALANFAGAPAISIPCGLTADGLPIGLQLVAARFQDHALLATARAFEAARPFPPMPEPGR